MKENSYLYSQLISSLYIYIYIYIDLLTVIEAPKCKVKWYYGTKNFVQAPEIGA